MDYLKLILTACILLLGFYTCLGVYRVWFSPIAKIPGPTLAKLTYWYEFYWDVIKVGQYTFHIRDLHDRYGPIICLNPHEVHINDPDFFDEIYVGASTGRSRNRWKFLMSAFGTDHSTFCTLDHNLHRPRRAALNPYFSKAKIRALQGRIEVVIEKLLERMKGFKELREPMSMGIAFTSVSHDIASSYAIDLQHFRIDAPDFGPDFHIASEKYEKSIHLMKQFPWLMKLIQAMPPSWTMAMDPAMGAVAYMKLDMQNKARDIRTAYQRPDYKPPERSTIFHEILGSDQIPEIEKSHTRIWQDAENIIVAATVTTAVTLSNIFFFLLSDSQRLTRLHTELATAIPDIQIPIQLPVLENLPYLTACIREALRVSNGLSSRVQRIDPEKPIIFHAKRESYGAPAVREGTYIIHPGTPVSMTQLLIHLNPRIYPEPLSFNPERWLEKDPVSNAEKIHHKLDKYFVAFSRGTRSCLGVNLAEAELYLITAMVFRRYGSKDCQMAGDEGYMELFDSSYERDIEIVGDGFTPIVREPLKGIKVLIHPYDVVG